MKTLSDFGVTVEKLRAFLKSQPESERFFPNDPNDCVLAALVKHENPNLKPEEIGVTESYIRYGSVHASYRESAPITNGTWPQRYQYLLSRSESVSPSTALKVLNVTLRGGQE